MAADGDLKIVNYALTLEYLEADFYAKVIESGLFSGASLEMIKVIGDHEQQHVDALLGTAKKLGEPAAKPRRRSRSTAPTRCSSLQRRSRTSALPHTSARQGRSRTRRSWPQRSRSTRSRRVMQPL